MVKKAKNNWALLVVAALTLLALGYVAVCGQRIYAQVGDNLDSNIPWFTMLRQNHLFFAQDAAVPFLGGIDRDYLPTEWNFYNLLYRLLPAFPAYILGNVLKIVLAVSGWMLLGRMALGEDEPRSRNLIVLMGFVYANLPTYPTLALAFGAMPLGLALLWQIYRAPRPWHYLLLVPLAATSDFSTIGIFSCGFLLLFFLLDWGVHRRPAWRMLVALAVLSISFVLLEYRLFGIMLFGGEPTLRDEFVANIIALRDVPAHLWKFFWVGDEKAATLQKFFVAPVCLLYFAVQNVDFIRRRNRKKLLTDPFNLLMYWAAFNAFVAAVQNTLVFRTLVERVLPLLSGFNFSRTLWLSPMVWYLAFTLIAVRLCRRGWAPLGYLLAACAFVVLLFGTAEFNEIQRNLECQWQRLQTGSCETLSWQEFYAEDLLADIKTEIGYDGEWTAAFGMHPGILEQSGFATLDGYLSYYPLRYKAEFRRLIAPALTPGSYFESYYDTWGGRAYLFAEGVPYGPLRTLPIDSATLPIDPAVFREMGGKYIISRVSVENATALGLTDLGTYTSETTPYVLHVYRAD